MNLLNFVVAAQRFGYGMPALDGFESSQELMAQLHRAKYIPDLFEGTRSKERIARDSKSIIAINQFNGSVEDRIGLIQERFQRTAAAYERDAHNRIIAAVESATPFFERLVEFWGNHFSVSEISGRSLGATLEVEAIRPHVMGNFGDLLLAVEFHPAMIGYLNLDQSTGPHSIIGALRRVGLNENLAREIMELHTIGVHGGYSQEDVTNFANIMTGWTINRSEGEVQFVGARAEPAKHLFLGHIIGVEGVDRNSYRDALALLAKHPATGIFVTQKLITHFIGADYSGNARHSLAAEFEATGGDLPRVYKRLVELPEAWKKPGAKARTDFEFLIASLRAAGLEARELAPMSVGERLQPNPLSGGALSQLAQPMWSAPSPAGWPEEPDYWLSPIRLARRLRWIGRFVSQIRDETAIGFCDRILGPIASERTRSVIQAASNREEGLALVLASPEFNRR